MNWWLKLKNIINFMSDQVWYYIMRYPYQGIRTCMYHSQKWLTPFAWIIHRSFTWEAQLVSVNYICNQCKVLARFLFSLPRFILRIRKLIMCNEFVCDTPYFYYLPLPLWKCTSYLQDNSNTLIFCIIACFNKFKRKHR